MMSSPIARERPGHAAEQSVEILVLSLDDTLIADVESSLGGAWRVHHARSDALAVDVLTDRNVGVLITDEAMEQAAFQKLCRQLREQFPNLIIIGVGEREAAPTLIDMVNGGQIYRFLLKPLSPGQVRLRVQSAAHQHLALREDSDAQSLFPTVEPPAGESAQPVEDAAAGGQPAAKPFWRRPLAIGIAVAVAVAALIIALLLMRAQQSAAPSPVTPDEAADAPVLQPAEPADAELTEVERLLDSASAALQQQRYIDPVEDNALDHYLAVLELEPENPEAAAGLDTVAGVLLEQAQKNLSEDRSDDALSAYGIAQEIRPAHPNLPLVEAAFTDHGRLLIASMNLAVAADDWARAREHLDLAAHFLPEDSTEIAAARALLAERLNHFAIAERVALANQRMDANSLTVPANDSAKFHLLALEAEHPDDAQVDAGLERLAAIMLERADSASLGENYEGAERWLAEVEQLGVAAEALAERRETLVAAQSPSAAEAEPETSLVEEAPAAGLGAEPEGAAGEAGADGDTLADVDTAPGAADYSDPAQPTAVPARIASTTPAGVSSGAGTRVDPEPVAVTELEIVRMVEPEYPRRAWVRDITGWVDLEFTVTETGLTRAIEVIDAQHGGWFDRSAVDAVEQWRFAPEQHDGQPVERRAKVRLQFTRD